MNSKSKERVIYPVGTVLWSMRGSMRHGKIYWAPTPQSIQVSHERGFLFDQSMADAKYGNSWNNIGRNYFLSREECLAKWGDKPFIEDDTRPVKEQERPDPKEYGKREVWLGDCTSTLYINVGFDKAPFPVENLTWRTDEGLEEASDDGRCLTLYEIGEQIMNIMGPAIIEVRVDGPLSGVIHQFGNHDNELWYEHGTTRGYA